MDQNNTFAFFDEIPEERINPQKISPSKAIPYTLNEVSVLDMRAYNACLYMSIKLKKSIKKDIAKETAIIKVLNNKIISEYPVFNKYIFSFTIRPFSFNNNKPLFFCLGSDFTEVVLGNDKTFMLLSSLKIFSPSSLASPQVSPTSINDINTIYLLRNSDTGQIIHSREFKKNHEAISGVICFDINPEQTSIVIGMERGEVILLNAIETFKDLATSSSFLLRKMPKATNDDITNISFSKWKDSIIIYFTTAHEIFYYFIAASNTTTTFSDYYNVSTEHGVDTTCLACRYNNILFASPTNKLLSQYDTFEKGPSWFIDGKKRHLSFFKQNYFMFLNQDISSPSSSKVKESLVIFDYVNKIYGYTYNQEKGTILGIASDSNYIFLLIESGTRSIVILKENDRYAKLKQFYNIHEYERAYSYAKSLGYDKETVTLISNEYGKHLYLKGDYKNAIIEYIKTINYTMPSLIIQLFLEGLKLDHLITYLEALHLDNTFSQTVSKNEMKDYTSLLFNTYIKQKKFKKMKEFIDNTKNFNKLHEHNIKIAIEVCKETKQVDFALSIASKSKLMNYSIEILIEMNENYSEALNFLSKESNVFKKFNLLMKYGQKLLQYNPIETMKIITPVIVNLIDIKTGREVLVGSTKDNQELRSIQYENIITIFINMDNELETLLDYIIVNDKNCSQTVIHRRIELNLNRLRSNNISPLEHKQSEEKIVNLLKDKGIQVKLDKNYILMLFKTHNFINGIIVLSEILELRQELLEIYMINRKYDKLYSTCESYGQIDKNVWIQVLRYFIERYKDDNKEVIDKYIKQILKRITLKEEIGSMIIMEMIKNTKDMMKYSTIKEFVIDSMKRQLLTLENDRKEREGYDLKLTNIRSEISELRLPKKIIKLDKCLLCQQMVGPPLLYFFCQHAFHVKCYGIDNAADNNIDGIECVSCKNKTSQLTQRIQQVEELSTDHNTFFIELNNKQKKFDLIAKYLGKGIFKMDERPVRPLVIKNNEEDLLNNDD